MTSANEAITFCQMSLKNMMKIYHIFLISVSRITPISILKFTRQEYNIVIQLSKSDDMLCMFAILSFICHRLCIHLPRTLQDSWYPFLYHCPVELVTQVFATANTTSSTRGDIFVQSFEVMLHLDFCLFYSISGIQKFFLSMLYCERGSERVKCSFDTQKSRN